MSGYVITKGDAKRRQSVADWLMRLDLVSSAMRENIITAWVTSWSSSPYESLEDMPYSLLAPSYRLVDHINDVIRIGIGLAERTQADWGLTCDHEILLPIFMLHDIDKPLIYRREGTGAVLSDLGQQLPHGVVGAMLLKDLGFPHEVVTTVATHAADAPFHGSNLAAYVLHYADMFATDHVMRMKGIRPFYQRRHL